MKKVFVWLEENLEEMVMVICLILMTLIMGIQVFSRYILGMSLSWSEEITRYLFVWSGFLSVSYCTRKCISIKIEQFVASFSRKTKALIKVINHTIEFSLFAYLLPFAYQYFRSSIDSRQVSPACGLPMYIVQAAPLVSFVMVLIRIAQRWYIEFMVFLGKMADPKDAKEAEEPSQAVIRDKV